MKKLSVLLGFLIMMVSASAQSDVYPIYTTEDYNILIDLQSTVFDKIIYDSIFNPVVTNGDTVYEFVGLQPIDTIQVTRKYYVKDPSHRICDSLFYYQLHGMKPVQGHRWISNVGGSQNSAGINTPPALLSELLKVYASGNTQQLYNLYRPTDAATINELFAVDSISERWHAATSQVNKFDVLMSLEVGNVAFMFVDAFHDNTVLFNTFFDFTLDNGTWHIAALADSSAVIGNLYLCLDQFNPYSMLSSDDIDEDGIPNLEDNCACAPNADQRDSDNDGVGDECDNCLYNVNPYQEDADDDGVGNACDNCPELANADQADRDHDGVGDACDICPDDFDPLQEYNDVNGAIYGLACDPDIDGDGILNEVDDDMDGDGWPNDRDNCPRRYNPDQIDSDGDGVGDVCDNCKLNSNPGQEDSDHDGVGDVCDDDQDGDGVPDDVDNCPEHFNPDQEDKDCNGIGDACQDFPVFDYNQYQD